MSIFSSIGFCVQDINKLNLKKYENVLRVTEFKINNTTLLSYIEVKVFLFFDFVLFYVCKFYERLELVI